MNKKTLVLFAVAATAAGVFAGPHGCPGGGGGCRPAPCHPGPHHPPAHHGGWSWGRGGSNFWPGFVGGLVGGAVASTVVQPTTVVVSQPAVVTTPVVATTTPVVVGSSVTTTTTRNVWVEGRYIDTVQPNGTVVRTWNPGHYEQQTVVVQ